MQLPYKVDLLPNFPRVKYASWQGLCIYTELPNSFLVPKGQLQSPDLGEKTLNKRQSPKQTKKELGGNKDNAEQIKIYILKNRSLISLRDLRYYKHETRIEFLKIS